MNTLRIFTYLAVIFTIIVHHTPILRAGLEVRTDHYYAVMAEEIGMWE